MEGITGWGGGRSGEDMHLAARAHTRSYPSHFKPPCPILKEVSYAQGDP